MNSLYFLIPLSVLLVGVIVAIFMWAVRSGQFDDLEGPAHSILMEEEVTLTKENLEPNGQQKEESAHKTDNDQNQVL